MKIDTFDRNNINALRKDIDEALRAVAEKHGIALNIGRITYRAKEFATRITGVAGDGVTSDEPEVSLYIKNASDPYLQLRYGITQEMLHKKVDLYFDGKEYEFVGISTKSPKNSYVFRKVSNGRLYVAPRTLAMVALGGKG